MCLSEEFKNLLFCLFLCRKKHLCVWNWATKQGKRHHNEARVFMRFITPGVYRKLSYISFYSIMLKRIYGNSVVSQLLEMTKGPKLSLTSESFPSKFEFSKACLTSKQHHTYGLWPLLKTVPDISNIRGKKHTHQIQLRSLCRFKKAN